MSESHPKAKRSGRSTIVVALVAAAVLGISVWSIIGFGDHDQPLLNHPSFAVARGPLTISVTEVGTIESRHQEVIKSQVEGTTTILYIVPEGTLVEQGDLLVELDASRLTDQLVDQEIRVQNAEASLIRAQENLAVVENQAEADVARAELDYRFAQEDLRQYVEGEFPKQETEAESRITIAQQELKRAQDRLEWSERLFEERYLSRTELEADQLAARKTELDLEMARNDLDLLRNFTYERRLAELTSEVEQTRMALDRARRKASADVIQATTDQRARQAEYTRESARLNKINEQIGFTTITAPTSGLVVYATSVNTRRNVEPLAEGQTVRERQDLIFLPTASAVSVEVKVHESVLEKVRVGQPVRVTVDAHPGKVYAGRVARIAPLPDAQSIWLNPDLKVYSTTIHVESDSRGLRTGMSCRAEILIEQYDDALYVPIQSVVRTGQNHVVYAVQGRELLALPVQIGLDNNRMVRILDGLDEGQMVSLTPPLSSGTAQDMDEAVPTAEPTDAATAALPASEAVVTTAAAVTAEPADSATANAEQRRSEEAQADRPSRNWQDMTPQQRQQMREARQRRQQNQEQP